MTTEPAAGPLKGRYALQERIGLGGMAVVYRATDTTLDRDVAVKVLRPQLSREPAFVERFLAMERRIARLFHPNLVTIFDAGTSDDGAFVVMEYVSGGSLRDRLTGGPLPVADVVRLVAQTGEALQALHDEGVLHGDVKPDNILVDDEGNAKLVDFGIAHLATTTGVLKVEQLSGTTPYIAPELLRNGSIDARSDVYALGLVAYELLAGRRAFLGDNWVAVAAQRLERDPDPLSELRPDTPPALERAINRAIAREPEQRFQSAHAFSEALLSRENPKPAQPRVVGGIDAPPTAPLLPPRIVVTSYGDGAAWDPPHPPHPPAAVSTSASRAEPRVWGGPVGTRAAARLTSSLWELRQGRPWLVPALVVAGALVLLLLTLTLPRIVSPPRPARVPQLTGQGVDAARASAGQAGLQLATSEEPSESTPNGTVLRQDPPADAITQNDRPVRIVISSGPPPVKVPDVDRRRLDDARKDLAAVGLRLGRVDQREASQEPWDTVIEQSARPGTDLALGGLVDVVVGIAPAVAAPKLLDKTLGEAEAELEKSGLRLSEVQLAAAAGKRAGTVIQQDPAPDVRLRRGETVAVTIAVPPAPTSSKP